MKQFIVLAAVLPLLMIFILQFSNEQINSSKAGIASDIIYAAKEEAKQQGCFPAELQQRMRAELSQRLGVDEELIEIIADSEPVYRVSGDYSRGLIHYRVKLPIGKSIAGEGFLGLNSEDNTYYFLIDSYTASERLEDSE